MTVVRIEEVEIGLDVEGEGPLVVFTHGYQASRAMWAPQLRAVGDRWRVVAWDLRGHGESWAPDDPAQYSHDLLLDDLGRVVRYAGGPPAVLVGHSLGGYASLRYALERRGEVRALVLFGSGPGYRDADARGRWNEMAERFARSVETKGLAVLGGASREVATARHRSAAALAHAARGMLAQRDAAVIEALASIDVPTLVIVGSEDRAFLASSEYMAKKMPQAQLVVIEGGGHAANLEEPEAFNAALVEFLDSFGRGGVRMEAG